MMRAVPFALAAVLALDTALPAAAQDVEAGKKVFNQCRACHAVEAGKNGVGPSLHGVVGRKTAGIENFRYSAAMKAKGEEGWTWTEERLLTYLENPRGVIVGTTMSFVGLKDEQQRKDVIAFLKAQQ
jgi:cytochrome c